MHYNEKSVFLHIPKTSGNTFHRHMGWNDTNTAHDVLLDHLDMLETRQSYSFVRNPFDWYRSLFSYLHRVNYTTNGRFGVLNFDTLEDFILSATVEKCRGMILNPEKRIRMRKQEVGKHCSEHSIGLFSEIFIYASMTRQEFGLNKDHVFFEIKPFYEHFNIHARENTSNSESYQLTERACQAIIEYDIPSYEKMMKQVSIDYDSINP